MMRTRVKICGVTRIEDAIAAARLGADAIGLVFYASSPRCVSPEAAAQIVAALPPFVTAVGLFVDADPGEIRAIVQKAQLDLVQYHGEESPETCASIGLPYIKAIRMRPGTDVCAAANRYREARAILLDAYHADLRGGTGTEFDWDAVPRNVALPLILAGGLTPDNVTRAIAQIRPYAVDVSSGVEQTKGIKDAQRMEAFINAALKAPRSARDEDTRRP